MVPNVVGLETKFSVQTLGKSDVLEQCHVPIVTPGTAQCVLAHVAEDRGCAARYEVDGKG